VRFIGCKLGAGVVIQSAAATVTTRAAGIVEAYDCNSGDNHYAYYHGTAYGETTAVTSIYATAGATTGGTGISYKVVTASTASYYNPYVGPWIAKPNTGTSAVTATFEVLRDASATAYQNDEIWGEWQYKGTASSVLLTTVNDRMAVLGTAANQDTGALAAGDWTGENATAWFGKLSSGSITPAEIGPIYGRVVVGEPSLTMYYDPQLRVA
jgi:hypothetical protein